MWRLHTALDGFARRYYPILAHFQAGYHWGILQIEYATDVVFSRAADFAPLYAALTHTAIHAVQPDHVTTFLGRKLTDA